MEKSNKINKSLAKLARGEKESKLIVRNEKKVTTKYTNVYETLRTYLKISYFFKFENLNKTDDFLDSYDLLKLN